MEDDKKIEQSEKDLEDNIFAYMDLTSQDFTSIMNMPFLSFQNSLKWKIDLEEAKKKKLENGKK